MPSASSLKEVRIRTTERIPIDDILLQMRSKEGATVIRGLESIHRETHGIDRERILAALYEISTRNETTAKSCLARVIGYLRWPELSLTLLTLLPDRKWVIRANSAKALLKYPNYMALLESAFSEHDRLVREVLVRSIEQNAIVQRELLPRLSDPNLSSTRTALVSDSQLIRDMYLRELGMTYEEFLSAELQAA